MFKCRYFLSVPSQRFKLCIYFVLFYTFTKFYVPVLWKPSVLNLCIVKTSSRYREFYFATYFVHSVTTYCTKVMKEMYTLSKGPVVPLYIFWPWNLLNVKTYVSNNECKFNSWTLRTLSLLNTTYTTRKESF